MSLAASAQTLPPRLKTAAELYERVKMDIPALEWPVYSDDVVAIEKLKAERDAEKAREKQQAE